MKPVKMKPGLALAKIVQNHPAQQNPSSPYVFLEIVAAGQVGPDELPLDIGCIVMLDRRAFSGEFDKIPMPLRGEDAIIIPTHAVLCTMPPIKVVPLNDIAGKISLN